MRVLLTGGGTAGHTWPLVLVAKSLLTNRRASLLYVGSRQGIEKKIVRDHKIPFKGLIVGKRRTYFSFANWWDLIKILLGIIQGLFVLLFFKPDVIFAKGGYVTVPIIFWLKLFKIPLVIHESDAVIGRANLFSAKSAKKICLGFPIEVYNRQIGNYKQNLPLEKLIYTGTPVNSEFLQTSIKTSDKLKLLITGGSQGSEKINGLIFQILPNLLKKYEVWHLAGQSLYDDLSKIDSSGYHLYKFTYDLPKYLRDADLVISRAGASTLSEISAASKAAIIVPIGESSGDHQVANAKVYAEKNAAVVLTEKNLSAPSLESIINSLMCDQKMRELLGHHAHSLYQKDATGLIIEEIYEAGSYAKHAKN